MDNWYERDAFWAGFAPALFGPDRWQKTPEAVDRLLPRLDLSPGSSILDLCCGPGRHALELTRRGYRVTGVDRTVAYLEEARRRAGEEHLEVEWVLEDMRRFARPGAFDGAINLFTSFGYFEDQADDLQVARNLCASLKPGGRLVMDMIGKECLARTFRERDWSWVDRDRNLLLLEERKLRPDWGWIESTWTLIGENERRSETIRHRLYAGTELATLLRTAGFAWVDIYGSLDGTPYDQTATRLVVVAGKAA